MKILLLTNHLNIGGVPIYTINLARELKKRGIAVFVASGGGELEFMLEEAGIAHMRLGVNTKFEFNPKLIIAFLKLLRFVRRHDITVIHAQVRVAQVLASGIARIAGVGYVSTCHGFFKEKRIGRKFVNAWGNSVIAISDAVKAHLIKDFRIKKEYVHLIYNGIDTERFGNVAISDEGTILKGNIGFAKRPVIGSVSRLSPVKGLKYLFLAMKDLMKEMPDACLLLVGDGPSRNFLMGLAEKLGIEGNVFFAHSIADTRKFLSIMDIFVFYSLEEGLGLSLLEAMASGKPCVASDVGGVSSIIENGRTGILVPPKDAHALKEALVGLLGDASYAAQLAEQGKRFVRDKFSIGTMVDKVLEVYATESK